MSRDSDPRGLGGADAAAELVTEVVVARRMIWVVLLLVLLTTLATTVAAHAASDPAPGPAPAPVPVTLLSPATTNAAPTLTVPPVGGATDVAGPLFRIFLALVLVLGALFGGAWLFRRMPELMGPRGAAPRLRVLMVRTLGGKHALFVIAYDQQRLLVGSSPNGISLIDRLPAEESLVSGNLPGTAAPTSFVAALGQILRSR